MPTKFVFAARVDRPNFLDGCWSVGHRKKRRNSRLNQLNRMDVAWIRHDPSYPEREREKGRRTPGRRSGDRDVFS